MFTKNNNWRAAAFFMLALLLLSLLFCACDKKKQIDSKDYVFKQGETLEYRTWITQQVDPDGKKENAIRVSIRADVDLKTESTDKKDTAALKLTFDNIRANMANAEGRKPLNLQAQMGNKSFSFDMNPKGRISNIKAPQSDTHKVNEQVSKLRRIIMDVFPTLPERLTNGTSWERVVKVSENFDPYGTIEAVTTTSFVAGGVKNDVYGHEATSIMVTFDIELHSVNKTGGLVGEKAIEGAPQDVRISGHGSGKGKMYFSSKLGRMISSVYESEVDVTADMLYDKVEENKSTRQIVRTRIDMRPREKEKAVK